MKTYKIENEEQEPVIKLEDGDRVIIPRYVKSFYHICCGCGLKHRVFIHQDKTKLVLNLNRL